jgi:hypothetical protein
MRKLIYLVVLLSILSCNQEDIHPYQINDNQFSIWIVKEGQLEIHDSPSDIDINSLKLESTPWIKSSEIELYDWSSHTFFLNTEKEKEKYSGRHFVVVSENERLFAGVFFPLYMSSMPQLPSILPMDDFFYPTDAIQFGQLGHQFAGDIENLGKFREELLKAGLLHEGIQVELTTVKKKNPTTILYSFEVTNHDKENLYVLDPGKMGASQFHYVTNGVWFEQNSSYYFPEQIPHTPFEIVPESWYYKLRPGQKMTRTVELTGFKLLPAGMVKCRFSFPGSIIKAGEWKKLDGRIWLGDFFVEKAIDLE